jgi:hypothetical protein
MISTPAQPWAYALSYTLRPPAVDNDGALLTSTRIVFDVSGGGGADRRRLDDGRWYLLRERAIHVPF